MSLEASQQQGEAEQGQRGRDELSRDAESPNVQAIPTVKVRFKPRVGVPVTRDVSKSFEQNVSIITTTEVALLGFSTVDKNGHAIEEIELELKSKGTSAIFFSETFKVVAPEAVSSGPPIALGHDGFVTLYGNQHPAHFCLAEKGKKKATKKEEAESKARHDREIEKENAQFLTTYLKQQKPPPPPKPRGRL